MNLAAVKRTDPYAVEIVETSAHVAFYTFNYEDNEWEKTDVEGAFFVYRRTAEPFHSIFINNRLNTESLVEPITADLELQVQPPFLLYRNERSRIRGFWFYNKDELERVATLVNRLGRECQKRQQVVQQQPQVPQPQGALANFMGLANNQNNSNNNSHFKANNGHAPMMDVGQMDPQKGPPNNVNIFSMLSKAQEDFYNSNNPVKMPPQLLPPPQQQQHPHQGPPQHPQIDGGSMLAALLPKMHMNGNGNPNGGKDGVTSQSVMNFFASAKPTSIPPTQQQQGPPHHHQPPVPMQVLHSNGNANGVGGGGGMKVASPAPPPLLQRLMSNPVHTVEQIEMQHRSVTPQEVSRKEEQQQPPKENGFNWKTKQTNVAAPVPVPATKANAAADKGKPQEAKNGTDSEMWPALFQKGGVKGAGNKPAAGGALEAPAAGDKTPANRKGQANKNQAAGSGPGVTSSSGAAAMAPKPALMTPTMFKKTEPLSKVDPTNPSLIATGTKREVTATAATGNVKSGGGKVLDLEIKPEPLTQSQMLQAMTYLMKTDAEFMKKLHEAYVKSFAEMMAQ